MNSAPVTDGNIALFNVVSNKGNNTVVSTDQSFAKTMNDISNQHKTAEATSGTKQLQNKNQTSNVNKEKKVQNDADSKGEKETNNATSTDKVEDVKETVTEDNAVSAEAKDAIKEAAEEIRDEIKESLDVSDEELEAAMNCLNMQMTDLLDQSKLTDLVVELSGTDMMSLVTDESLYKSIQDLTTSLQDMLNGLTEQFGITEEMIKQACKEISAEMSQVDFSNLEQSLMDESLQRTETVVEQEPVITSTQGNKEQITTNVEDTSEDFSKEDIPDTHADHVEKKQHENNTQQNEQQAGFGENGYKQETFDATLNETQTMTQTQRTPDTENIMRQIMDYMNVKVKEDLTEMEMQLHPASLGTVNLQIATRGGAVTAQFTVQNETVKNALESQVVELKNNLEEQGVKIEAVEVTVASHEFERNLSDQNHNQSEQQEMEETKVKSARRKIINLNEYESLDEITEETDDAVRIAMELMASNGNTLDMLA